MTGTRLQEQFRRREAAAAHVHAAVRALAPHGMAEPELKALLHKARVVSGVPLREVGEHLAAHPDALTSGDGRCPAGVIRLVHVLFDAGYDTVARPVCAGCGKLTADLCRPGPAGRICQMCLVRTTLATCARCGSTGRRIAANRTEGGICYLCYRTDEQVVEACAGCGRERNPAARLADGRALCQWCNVPVGICAGCGRQRPVANLVGDQRMCARCYQRDHQPRRTCGGCGRQRLIARRAAGGRPDLCADCAWDPTAICSNCGRAGRCWRSGPQRRWLCRTCRVLPTAVCARCDRFRKVDARWPIGPVCPQCYRTFIDNPADCGHCQRARPLIGIGAGGLPICGPCAGVGYDYTCTRCGNCGKPYGTRGCARCVLADRLRVLLAGPDGTVPPAIQPVLAALAASGQPHHVLRWITTSSSAALLSRMAADQRPVSHSLLDELSRGRDEFHVRRMLVHTGVLPARDEDLESIPAWLERILAERPEQHARLIRPFTHWQLLRRARRRAAARRYPAHSGPQLRGRIRAALNLLDWLDSQGLALAELDQSRLDQWLATGAGRRHEARYFLGWTAKRGLTKPLTVPTTPRPDSVRLLSEDVRWKQLHRCLTDAHIPLDARAAGALVLMYGLPLSRIRCLTVDRLHTGDTWTTLLAGRKPVALPPRLAHLLHTLAETPPAVTSELNRTRPATRWLFPGLAPGQPISANGLQRKLGKHGISIRVSRSTALVSLAADLPAPVLADLLGMHPGTAVRWARLAQRDWTDYLAARAADQAKTAGKRATSGPNARA